MSASAGSSQKLLAQFGRSMSELEESSLGLSVREEKHVLNGSGFEDSKTTRPKAPPLKACWKIFRHHISRDPAGGHHQLRNRPLIAGAGPINLHQPHRTPQFWSFAKSVGCVSFVEPMPSSKSNTCPDCFGKALCPKLMM